jgi:AraC-like DNA-binding protein/ligand-binding sensor protein
MKDPEKASYLAPEDLDAPVLVRLDEAAQALAGVSLFVVFPQADGWGQRPVGAKVLIPDYCKVVRSTKEGAKRCSMCHVLMTVAACSRGANLQRCHARASVMVVPSERRGDEALAILSSCVFAPKTGDDGWEDARACGKKLGLDLRKLKRAYERLPQLTPERIKAARAIMRAAAVAVGEIKHCAELTAELEELRGRSQTRGRVEEAVDREMRTAVQPSEDESSPEADASGKKKPLVVEVVAELVRKKPYMPFTVAEIAAAARITPNHFSTLFHRHQSVSFSQYLTERRMALAKTLLQDFTMNITEVARRSGYDDPGYFGRLFKKRTGMTPRDWRDELRSAKS